MNERVLYTPWEDTNTQIFDNLLDQLKFNIYSRNFWTTCFMYD